MAEWTETTDEAPAVSEERDEGKVLVILPKEELREIIRETAVTSAAETIQKMEGVFEGRTKAYRDKRLHNTDLLLRNYRSLKKGCKEAVWNREVARKAYDEMDVLMLMKADDRVIVDSIKQSTEKTEVILAHIDRMLDVYHTFCQKNGPREKRRYNAIKLVYMTDKKLKMSEIADKLGIATSQLYADLAVAKESLAALIFGVDGLRFMS